MLYIFDLDGTLVEKYGEQPLSSVVETLGRLVAEDAQIAVATNQAGPAWGVVTGEPKYPDPHGMGARFARIARRVPPLSEVPWFVAVGDTRLPLSAMAYELLIAQLQSGAGDLILHASASSTWRKPEPGMLLAACDRFGVGPDEVVYIGDADSDAEAATRAGTAFVAADTFFGVTGPMGEEPSTAV